MILDGQNYFSDLASGDSPTLVQDTPSSYVIDQNVKDGIFTQGGGANKALFIKALVQTLFATSASGTIQAVLQDSPDNVTWTDRMLGTATAAASATRGLDLFANQRIPSSLARYVRCVWRIGTGVMTAGTIVAFLTPEQDLFDLDTRQATAIVTPPTGAADESVANGILAS